MRVAGLIRDSLVNGEGMRDVLFVQGCPHHCHNCQNPQTWDFDGGREISVERLAEMFKDSPNNITLSGGEPFSQWRDIVEFMELVTQDNPNKRFWIYTGFVYDDIKHIVEEQMLPYVDVVIDGKFVEELKSQDCLYRGSTNQRLIDVQKTHEYGIITKWSPSSDFK